MFIGIELVKDRSLRIPSREAADFVLQRFRAEKVLMQADGPDVNVIKMKPPLCFDKVGLIVAEKEAIEAEKEAIEAKKEAIAPEKRP